MNQDTADRMKRILKFSAAIALTTAAFLGFQNCAKSVDPAVNNSATSIPSSGAIPPSPTPGPTPAALCKAGTYSINANGEAFFFVISTVSNTGAFSGAINAGSQGLFPLAGNCQSGVITFDDSDAYVGTYTSTSMSGTFTYAGVSTYPWTASFVNSSIYSVCLPGIYSLNANGIAASLTISTVAINGDLTGQVDVGSTEHYPATGSCQNGKITFNDTAAYMGTYTDTSMVGTFTYPGGSVYPWKAGLIGKQIVSFTDLQTTIFTPKCVGCHSAGSKAGGFAFDSYSGVLAAINKVSPLTSAIYTATISGAMPAGGTPLSIAQEAQILSWVLNGAPNN